MKCFECDAPAQCDHHVIPKSLGGTKTVPLCRPCHSKVHSTDLVSMIGLQKQGKKSRKAKGGYVGGVVPFGWRFVEDPYNPTRKIKVKHIEEQKIIAELKIWISQKRTYQDFSNLMIISGTDKNPSAWCKIHKRES